MPGVYGRVRVYRETEGVVCDGMVVIEGRGMFVSSLYGYKIFIGVRLIIGCFCIMRHMQLYWTCL